MHRFATPADAPALAELVNSVYRAPHTGWKTETAILHGPRIDVHAVQDILNTSVILVFPQQGPQIEACVNLERHQTYAYLGLLCVRQDLQDQGYARRVLQHAEQFIRTSWQLAEVRMTVIAQRRELIAYYQRRGYQLTGETQPFPYDDPSLGTPQRPDLHFAVLQKTLANPPE
jgi:ribosomal protein S18 acetylase RimI-like enzyme